MVGAENTASLALCRRLGFRHVRDVVAEDGSVTKLLVIPTTGTGGAAGGEERVIRGPAREAGAAEDTPGRDLARHAAPPGPAGDALQHGPALPEHRARRLGRCSAVGPQTPVLPVVLARCSAEAPLSAGRGTGLPAAGPLERGTGPAGRSCAAVRRRLRRRRSLVPAVPSAVGALERGAGPAGRSCPAVRRKLRRRRSPFRPCPPPLARWSAGPVLLVVSVRRFGGGSAVGWPEPVPAVPSAVGALERGAGPVGRFCPAVRRRLRRRPAGARSGRALRRRRAGALSGPAGRPCPAVRPTYSSRPAGARPGPAVRPPRRRPGSAWSRPRAALRAPVTAMPARPSAPAPAPPSARAPRHHHPR